MEETINWFELKREDDPIKRVVKLLVERFCCSNSIKLVPEETAFKWEHKGVNFFFIAEEDIVPLKLNFEGAPSRFEEELTPQERQERLERLKMGKF